MRPPPPIPPPPPTPLPPAPRGPTPPPPGAAAGPPRRTRTSTILISVERSLGEEEDDGARSRVGQHALDQAEPGRQGEHEQDQPAPDHRHHALDPLLAPLRLLNVPSNRNHAARTHP